MGPDKRIVEIALDIGITFGQGVLAVGLGAILILIPVFSGLSKAEVGVSREGGGLKRPPLHMNQ